jgi:hypothetical protein
MGVVRTRAEVAGIADPVGFDGDFRAKPGVFEIAPGDYSQGEMRVTLTAEP